MVPQKLHYCWLSGDPKPPVIAECMASWQKVMPDYEVVCWDTDRFDVDAHPFVREAVSAGKWAFAADYIRLHAVHSEGGIYLDSDVMVKRRFDDFLNLDFFTSVEYHPNLVEQGDAARYLDDDGRRRVDAIGVPGIGLQAAVFGGIAGHPLLARCLEHYRDRHFVLPDGGFDTAIIAPGVYAAAAEAFGFRYRDELQRLSHNATIFPSTVFAGHVDQETPESYAVHRGVGSWKDPHRPSIARRLRRLPARLRGAFDRGRGV